MVTVSESLATPPDVKEKIHLLYKKSKFVEKSMQNFSGERPRKRCPPPPWIHASCPFPSPPTKLYDPASSFFLI